MSQKNYIWQKKKERIYKARKLRAPEDVRAGKGKWLPDNGASCRLIVAIVLLFFLPVESVAIELHASWEYNASASGLAGFKLYKNGTVVCETNDPAARQLSCDIPLPFEGGMAEFTITALGLSGQESPHSDPFAITFYPPSATPPGSPILPGDIDCNGVVDLNDLHLVEEIISGSTPSKTVCLEADVNGDAKLGQEEINYILKHLIRVP